MDLGRGRSASGVSIAVAIAIAVGAIAVGSRVADAGDDARPVTWDVDPVPAEPLNPAFEGLPTFRGNATRTYMGEGPVPSAPVIRWRSPEEPMCSMSTVGLDGTPLQEWCGTGWTGQPNVVVLDDGTVEVREGAYDGAYHFIDGATGQALRPPLQTGDLAKGSATTDPDGYPLYYGGSRDDMFRVIALDRPEPTVLWSLDANTSVPEPLWNDDWDGAPLVIRGHVLLGGENGWFYVIDLRRSYGPEGVTVDPTYEAVPGFDDALLAAIGDDDVSIESSVAYDDGIAYVANSGGLVTGWDVSGTLADGTPPERVFRFWTGDDTDATVVIDDEGFLYVASELQRFTQRSREVGQLMKLDPSDPGDPVVWSIDAPEIGFQGAGGSWSTPAVWGDLVVFATAAGRVLGVDRVSGEIAWELQVGAPSIVSPVIVDGTLIHGDSSGRLVAWDLTVGSGRPPLRWTIDLGDCIESTPAVWDGWIYVGTREGYLYGIADRDAPPPGA
ncbi:MAG TPA: PQQ-binding-like beta-propeller repeat protein [Actinomycetota bacterium]|nr:PQQ-binding-like beta-propeller repeat protein [Actinomycetota bacterium]